MRLGYEPLLLQYDVRARQGLDGAATPLPVIVG